MNPRDEAYEAMRRTEMNDWVGGADPAFVGLFCNDILQRLSSIGPRSRVIDFGCGIGRAAVQLLSCDQPPRSWRRFRRHSAFRREFVAAGWRVPVHRLYAHRLRAGHGSGRHDRLPAQPAQIQDGGRIMIGDPTDPLAFIAYDPSLIATMVWEAGLVIAKVEYGTWMGGKVGASLQDVYVCRKPRRTRPTGANPQEPE